MQSAKVSRDDSAAIAASGTDVPPEGENHTHHEDDEGVGGNYVETHENARDVLRLNVGVQYSASTVHTAYSVCSEAPCKCGNTCRSRLEPEARNRI